MKMIITGAASGIGLACAEYYFCHELTTPDKKELDLSDPKAVIAFIDHNSDFDVFIHCAGIREIEKPDQLSFLKWQEILNVNLTSSFLISQKLISQALIRKKSLTIINIASVAGLQAEPDRVAYVSSKFGLIGLTKQLAWQYGPHGIRVNAIAPGIIETPLTRDYFNDCEMADRIRSAIPVGSWGQPSDIVQLVDVCINNSYLNGAVLVCDGGWTIGRNL